MIRDLDSHCIKDGQHAHNGSAMWNPEFTDGPMCEKHKNGWLQENDKEPKNKVKRDYTQPDERTPAWKEKKAHEFEYYRARVIQNDR